MFFLKKYLYFCIAFNLLCQCVCVLPWVWYPLHKCSHCQGWTSWRPAASSHPPDSVHWSLRVADCTGTLLPVSNPSTVWVILLASLSYFCVCTRVSHWPVCPGGSRTEREIVLCSWTLSCPRLWQAWPTWGQTALKGMCHTPRRAYRDENINWDVH